MLENSLTLNPDQQVYENGVLKYPLMKTGRCQGSRLGAEEQPRISLRDLEQPYKSIVYFVLIPLITAAAINLCFDDVRKEVFDALTKSTIEEKTIE